MAGFAKFVEQAVEELDLDKYYASEKNLFDNEDHIKLFHSLEKDSVRTRSLSEEINEIYEESINEVPNGNSPNSNTENTTNYPFFLSKYISVYR